MVVDNLKDLVIDVTPVLLVDVRRSRVWWALSALDSGRGGCSPVAGFGNTLRPRGTVLHCYVHHVCLSVQNNSAPTGRIVGDFLLIICTKSVGRVQLKCDDTR